MKFSIIILILLLAVGCKQDPMYQLKEPFGDKTASAIDELESENESNDFIKIPKKYLDKAKLKERDRKNQFIQKKLRAAQKFDPTL